MTATMLHNCDVCLNGDLCNCRVQTRLGNSYPGLCACIGFIGCSNCGRVYPDPVAGPASPTSVPWPRGKTRPLP